MERVLFLTIKKRWFNLIKEGVKKTEYREIKPRITNMLKKEYDYVLFQNGYSKNSSRLKVEFKQAKIHFIQGGKDCIPMYGIELGEIIKICETTT